MNPRNLIIFGLLFISSASYSGEKISEKVARDETFNVKQDDPAMELAFQKARKTLDGFFKIAEGSHAGLSHFAIKVGIPDGENTEYFWVNDFSHNGNAFSGRLANDGELIPRLREGDIYKFTREDIFDWMYFDESKRKMYGNFTACALLTHEEPADAKKFMMQYGLEC